MQPIDPSIYTVPLPLVWAILVAIVTVGGGMIFTSGKLAIAVGRWMERYDALEGKVAGHGEQLGVVQAVQHEHSDRIEQLRLDVSQRLAGVEAHVSHHGRGDS